MAEPQAYLNGRFLPQVQAALSWHDAGFVLGATVSDLCRTFRHRLYRWSDHLGRFRRSCRAACIDMPVADAELTARAEELVARNAKELPPEGDLALVLFATPGPVGYYLGEPGGAGAGPVTFGMHTFPLPFARYRPMIERGAALVISGVRQIPTECVDAHIKQRSRMHYWLADREAQRQEPGALALLLDGRGYVTETAAANFVMVRDGHVLSPRSETILEGVSLGVVRALCHELGVPFAEADLTPQDLTTASEAIVTSTTYCLAGVRSVAGQAIPWPGPIFSRLQAAWSAQVGVDIRAQIFANSAG